MAGVKSSTGGSRVLLQLAKQGKIHPVISSSILQETHRNLLKKFTHQEQLQFLDWLKITQPAVVALPDISQIKVYTQITHNKDAHILAAAEISQVKYVVTLDKRHLLSLHSIRLPFQIVNPGQLIQLL